MTILLVIMQTQAVVRRKLKFTCLLLLTGVALMHNKNCYFHPNEHVSEL